MSLSRTTLVGVALSIPVVVCLIIKFQKKNLKKKDIQDLTLAFGSTKEATEVLQNLLDSAIKLDIDVQDVYGNARPEGGNWLADFESKVALDLGKEAGLFVPSGTMAQQMMLKIAQKRKQQSKDKKTSFVAHPTSHLLRWEHGAHEALCNIDVAAVGNPTRPFAAANLDDFTHTDDADSACCVILEVPHREIGGEITEWADVQKMKKCCQANDYWFHMDGARLWEALPFFARHENGGLTAAQVCAPFDSVYVSFYKGLGGMCGAMLLGDQEFITEARVWLRRFGGNLYTALPYAVADLDAYNNMRYSFTERTEKAVEIVEVVNRCAQSHGQCIEFTPNTPQCSLVHCHIKATEDDAMKARDRVVDKLNVKVFRQLRSSYLGPGFHYFEWNFGPVNGGISIEIYEEAWNLFCSELTILQKLTDVKDRVCVCPK